MKSFKNNRLINLSSVTYHVLNPFNTIVESSERVIFYYPLWACLKSIFFIKKSKNFILFFLICHFDIFFYYDFSLSDLCPFFWFALIFFWPWNNIRWDFLCDFWIILLNLFGCQLSRFLYLRNDLIGDEPFLVP